jgi:hypothetical protein
MAEQDYLGEHVAPSGEVDEHGVDPVTTDPVISPEGSATVVTEHDKAVIDHAREVVAKEYEDNPDTDGPADTYDGSQSDKLEDHQFSADPFKRAFPPVPHDPTKHSA